MRLAIVSILVLYAVPTLAQDPIPAPPEPFPHLGIEALSGQIAKLGDSSLIPTSLESELKRPLAQSLSDLQLAEPSRAIQHLDVFKNKLSAQVAPDISELLVMQADAVQGQINAIASRIAFASNGQCVVPASDDFQTLQVGPAEELPTILSALAFASEQGWTAVELVLAPVAYREGLITIDRHTRITSRDGAANIVGGLINNGPYLLDLRDIIITGSAGNSILADNACATTILSNVEVQYSEGTGVRQRGGSFTADGLNVVLSNASGGLSSADRDIGRGVHLSHGTNACITSAILDANGAGALLAEGSLTRIFVSRMSARNNAVSPVVIEEILASGDTTSGFASVEIRDAALLLGELISVSSDEIVGLAIDGSARAHVRYSLVERVSSVRVGPFKSVGGINYTVLDGQLELTGIGSQRSSAGLVVNNINGGFLKTNSVYVSQNDVGVSVQTASEEGAKCALHCLNSPRYVLNKTRAQFGPFLPLPDPFPTGEPPPGCICPSIEFSPLWCTE